MTLVDVVIVNWNAGTMLRRCLELIAQGDTSKLGKVIVVDNGSTDGSTDVAITGLDLIIDKVGANLGFGKACNRGAKHCDKPYLLFLNPDVEVGPCTIRQTVEAMEASRGSNIAVRGIRLIGDRGYPQRHCARFPRWHNFCVESFGLSKLCPKIFRPVALLEFDHLSSQPVDHVIGAYYCMRRDVFEELKGFDEDYFVYFEDLDLSRRLAKRGWIAYFETDIEAYHKGGGTSEQVKADRLAYAIGARLTYARKHLTRIGYWAVCSAAVVVEPVTRTFYALYRRKYIEVIELVRAYKSLIFPTNNRHLTKDRLGG